MYKIERCELEKCECEGMSECVSERGVNVRGVSGCII